MIAIGEIGNRWRCGALYPVVFVFLRWRVSSGGKFKSHGEQFRQGNTEIFLRKMEKYKNTFKNRWCPPRMYFGRYIHHIWSFSTDAYFISGEVKNILHDSQKRCLFESKIPRNLELLTNLNMDLLSELKQRPPNGLHFSFWVIFAPQPPVNSSSSRKDENKNIAHKRLRDSVILDETCDNLNINRKIYK